MVATLKFEDTKISFVNVSINRSQKEAPVKGNILRSANQDTIQHLMQAAPELNEMMHGHLFSRENNATNVLPHGEVQGNVSEQNSRRNQPSGERLANHRRHARQPQTNPSNPAFPRTGSANSLPGSLSQQQLIMRRRNNTQIRRQLQFNVYQPNNSEQANLDTPPLHNQQSLDFNQFDFNQGTHNSNQIFPNFNQMIPNTNLITPNQLPHSFQNPNVSYVEARQIIEMNNVPENQLGSAIRALQIPSTFSPGPVHPSQSTSIGDIRSNSCDPELLRKLLENQENLRKENEKLKRENSIQLNKIKTIKNYFRDPQQVESYLNHMKKKASGQ